MAAAERLAAIASARIRGFMFGSLLRSAQVFGNRGQFCSRISSSIAPSKLVRSWRVGVGAVSLVSWPLTVVRRVVLVCSIVT